MNPTEESLAEVKREPLIRTAMRWENAQMATACGIRFDCGLAEGAFQETLILLNQEWGDGEDLPSMSHAISEPDQAKIARSISIPLTRGGHFHPRTSLYYSIEVTDAVSEWMGNPDTNFGFCISEIRNHEEERFQNSRRNFASSRSECPPQLIIHAVD
ncbi:MAG: hypothetical protein ACPGN3_07530 [Opitutales bacterium]